MPELVLSFDSHDALEREHEANLRHGRAFVAGQRGGALFDPCVLRLSRGDTGAVLDLQARVVMVSDHEPMRGTAVELVGAWRESLDPFVKNQVTKGDALVADGSDLPEPGDEPREDDARDGVTPPRAGERHQRFQKLAPLERARVAQGLKLDDRVLLERIFGSAVWELLLRSPHVTIPEVARIARKGTLPQPLADAICDNAQWIRQDIVRRALLSNPRVTSEGVLKILRATPPRELKLIVQQTSYPLAVRIAARKLMPGG